MIRARYERRGPVPQDVIHPAEFRTPRPSAGQALVEVVAAPINPSDVLTLTGEYGELPPLPAIGGREGVGRVAELGEGIRDLTAGQLVLLPVGCGTWSTHVVAEAAHLTPVPSEADPLQLSMMTINPPTAALLLLSEFVTLGPGDWVIQNAANSAVGLYLVQLARHRGHRTVNVVRRDTGKTAAGKHPPAPLKLNNSAVHRYTGDATLPIRQIRTTSRTGRPDRVPPPLISEEPSPHTERRIPRGRRAPAVRRPRRKCVRWAWP